MEGVNLQGPLNSYVSPCISLSLSLHSHMNVQYIHTPPFQKVKGGDDDKKKKERKKKSLGL